VSRRDGWVTVVATDSLADGRGEFARWRAEHDLTGAELEDAVRLDVVRLREGATGMRVRVRRDMMERLMDERPEGAAPSSAAEVHGLNLGDIAEWEVVSHRAWGLEMALVGRPDARATIDIPYIRDLVGPDRIDGPEHFPPVGTRMRAWLWAMTPGGQRRLTARESDLDDARRLGRR
jgi:hypothetical protein